MKYAIRHIGGSEFLAGFEGQHADPVWVEGWDNPEKLLYETYEDAYEDLNMVQFFFHAYIEEIA
jgi:hypothetical protein